MDEKVYTKILFDYCDILSKFELAPKMTEEQISNIDSITLMELVQHGETTCSSILKSAGYVITSEVYDNDIITQKLDAESKANMKLWKATNTTDATVNIALVTVVGIHAILIHVMKDVYTKFQMSLQAEYGDIEKTEVKQIEEKR